MATWSNDDDCALCRSWVATAERAYEERSFWPRIQRKMLQEYETDRSCMGIQRRWSRIIKQVVPFIACYRDADGEEADALKRARRVFYKKARRDFIFDHCWTILRDSPTFMDNWDVIPAGKRCDLYSWAESPSSMETAKHKQRKTHPPTATRGMTSQQGRDNVTIEREEKPRRQSLEWSDEDDDEADKHDNDDTVERALMSSKKRRYLQPELPLRKATFKPPVSKVGDSESTEFFSLVRQLLLSSFYARGSKRDATPLALGER